MTNNEVLKKLRVALSLKDTDVIEILHLADFDISKGALGDLFRSEDHPNFVEAGDQILRNFLNGLIVYKRGPEMKREGGTPKQKSEKQPLLKKDFDSKPNFKKPNTESIEKKSLGKSTTYTKGDIEGKKSLFEKDFFAKKR